MLQRQYIKKSVKIKSASTRLKAMCVCVCVLFSDKLQFDWLYPFLLSFQEDYESLEGLSQTNSSSALLLTNPGPISSLFSQRQWAVSSSGGYKSVPIPGTGPTATAHAAGRG